MTTKLLASAHAPEKRLPRVRVRVRVRRLPRVRVRVSVRWGTPLGFGLGLRVRNRVSGEAVAQHVGALEEAVGDTGEI